jgi:lipopolysaccharide biosynthesis glycosyltransferase
VDGHQPTNRLAMSRSNELNYNVFYDNQRQKHLSGKLDMTMEIVCCTDEKFSIPMGVMFTSLLENTSKPSEIRFSVINDGISSDNKNKLRYLTSQYGAKLRFIPVDKGKYENFHIRPPWSLAAYYRISIPEIIELDVRKAIYLDCDLIINDDIQKLMEFDLNRCLLAAVEDLSDHTYRKSGLPKNKYFNSGVLVIDLEKWRINNIPFRVREFVKNSPHKMATLDQCALNGVLFNDWYRLPLRWNQQPAVFRKKWWRTSFEKDEFEDALWSPAIIHYVGLKPWNYISYHPLTVEFEKYYFKSPWHNEIDMPFDSKDYMGKYFSYHKIKKWFRQKRWEKRYRKREDRI